ncbi:MAG: hypothetical protein GY851_34870 [bacterium]|nr:hypothetical protein [bacterium]
MRFGKRNRSPLIWGRRARAASEESEFRPVASEERDALLSPGSAEGAPDPDVDSLPLSGDPTQRLLTVLGRFEREMLKGKDGDPQNTWSDAAMRQLIHAAEVAYEQDWRDMVTAVTETARILQTYENAGRANDSVSFLADSYEILCLMVGDLIVDKVRSGVMRKWRERHEQVLEDVAADGLELVPDEGPETLDDVQATALEPAGEDSPFDTGAFDEPEAAPSASNLPSLGDIAMPDDDEPEEEPIDEALLDLESPEPLVEDAPADASPMPPGLEDASDLAGDNDSDLDDMGDLDDALLAAQAGGAPALDETVLVGEAILDEDEGVAPEEVPGTQMADILDALCEGLKRLEKKPGGDMQTTHAAMEEALDLLQQQASECNRDDAVEACRAMKHLCDGAILEERPSTDRFFELAYAFCGAYAADGEDETGTGAADWVSECREFVDSWAVEPEVATTQEPEVEDVGEEAFEVISDAVPEETSSDAWPLEPEPVAEAVVPAQDAAEPVPTEEVAIPDVEDEPVPEAETPAEVMADDGSPQYLLETARNAATLGNAADAKVFALQAAAGIARTQADQASLRVQEAEARLQEGAQAIEQVRSEVVQAENDVGDAEQTVAARDENVQTQTGEVASAAEALDATQQRLDDLDAQLRELQARRDEASTEREERDSALADARERETAAQEERDREAEIEKQARVRLEDARQRVKGLERRRAEIESAMEKARELLTRQRASVDDIERTIQEIQSAESGDGGDGSELLF